VVEQLMAIPENTNVKQVIAAVVPINGDPLRSREPKGDISDL
jgi:hypothetical protein